ncbi:hypothetical protein BDW59DRAFT_178357 [Aspergillus cavernicola]|uniref:Zn(2)-C6 fungal-type domain-containing protein n=1 Tax=Aspergillus cavernicola TaxID=176166 RepID=A0ABR4HC39_9EURO
MSLVPHCKAARRGRNPKACGTCRAKRTKCDGQRPQCSFCLERGRDCSYLGIPELPATPLEAEISTVWERLDQISAALGTLSPRQGNLPQKQGCRGGDIHNGSYMVRGFPYMTLQNESFMALLGLGKSFSRHIERVEHSRNMLPLRALQVPVIMQKRAWRLLKAFAEHVHIWYPLLHAGFTSEFVHSISNAFPPSPEPCLTLLVLAIGLGHIQGHPYVEAAMQMLPCILAGNDEIRSTQCLLFSIYFLCCVQPCQAYAFASMASDNLQIDLKNIIGWISLLIERLGPLATYIIVQLDIGNSGIWDLSTRATTLVSCETWTLPLELPAPLGFTQYTAAKSDGSSSGLSEPDMSYFITKIALRKMFQHCNWSVRELSPGRFAYAPIIAAELERQLDEWRRFLPERYSFLDHEGEATSSLASSSPQVEFLRTQYYAFKASVYWPAVYQALDTGGMNNSLIFNCRQFFESYVAFVNSAARAVQLCLPNLWTLCTSVFTISMAALIGSTMPCLIPVVNPAFTRSLELAVQILEDVRGISPSLAEMGLLLKERASQRLSSPNWTTMVHLYFLSASQDGTHG